MNQKRVLAIAAVLTVCGLLSACATFFQPEKQAIRVSSSPASATVSVNGKPKGSAPTVVWLSRTKKNQVIRFEAPGYNPVEVKIGRHVTPLTYLGDVAFGVAVSTLYEGIAFLEHDERASTTAISMSIGIGVPVLIDLATGRANTLAPKTLSVTLTKAEGPPRLETVSVDAAALPDLERITVRRD